MENQRDRIPLKKFEEMSGFQEIEREEKEYSIIDNIDYVFDLILELVKSYVYPLCLIVVTMIFLIQFVIGIDSFSIGIIRLSVLALLLYWNNKIDAR